MTSTVATVRSATAADIAAITAIYAHHVQNGFGSFEIEAPDGAEMETRRLNVVRRGLPFVVAELDDRIVGYAYAGPYRARPAYRFTVEDSVYIHPAFIGQGLGSRLLPHLIQLCAGRGCRQMVAVIGDSDNQASIRLHTSFGFRTVGVLANVGFKFGRWVDTVLMQRALAED